jgi:hypothetical protein
LIRNPNSYTNHFPWHLASKLSIPPNTKQEQASAFYQLKIGHGYIKSYLYRIKRADTDSCRCGRRETAEHLLLACPEGCTLRQKLKRDLENAPLSLKLLLHTEHRIKKSLNYIKTTGIATRKWHLERPSSSEEEEEEEEEEERIEEERRSGES